MRANVRRKSDSRVELNLELRMQFYQWGADVSILRYCLNFCSRVNVIIPESVWNENAGLTCLFKKITIWDTFFLLAFYRLTSKNAHRSITKHKPVSGHITLYKAYINARVTLLRISNVFLFGYLFIQLRRCHHAQGS